MILSNTPIPAPYEREPEDGWNTALKRGNARVAAAIYFLNRLAP